MKNNCRSNNLDKNDFDIPINSKLGLISNCFLTLYSHHREWYSGRCSSIRLMNSSNHFYFHLCQYELICTLYAADSRFTVAFHNVLFYVIRCFPVDKKTILHWSRNFLSSLRYTLFDGIEIEMIFVSFRDRPAHHEDFGRHFWFQQSSARTVCHQRCRFKEVIVFWKAEVYILQLLVD